LERSDSACAMQQRAARPRQEIVVSRALFMSRREREAQPTESAEVPRVAIAGRSTREKPGETTLCRMTCW
jgi:hypothetical protein